MLTPSSCSPLVNIAGNFLLRPEVHKQSTGGSRNVKVNRWHPLPPFPKRVITSGKVPSLNLYKTSLLYVLSFHFKIDIVITISYKYLDSYFMIVTTRKLGQR